MLSLLILLAACLPVDAEEETCTDGDEQCSPAGDAIERCEAGTWKTWQTCDTECVVDEGVPECVTEGTGSDADR